MPILYILYSMDGKAVCDSLMDTLNNIVPKGTIIQSVERAVHILKCFEDSRELRIMDLSRMLGLHKSTISGLVNTLCHLNFLDKDESTSKYRLGTELFRLGAMVDISLRNIVTPYLKEIVEKCQETANLLIPDGSNVLYVEKIESPHSMRICTEIGRSLPMHCTASGKAILAAMDSNEADELIDRMEFSRYTDKTILSKEELKAHLGKVRQMGFAIDNEEFEVGLICLGTAIRGQNGHPVGAMSVSGPIMRMDHETCNEITDMLLEYSSRVSRQL